MARLKTPQQMYHSLRMRSDDNLGEALIVFGGKGIYLWVGHDTASTGSCLTFSGPKTLEKFARELLWAFGEGDV